MTTKTRREPQPPSATTIATVKRLLRTKGTWEMTGLELAKVVSVHYGWSTREGGWVYDENGTPIVQGWDALAERLRVRGWIRTEPGRGAINWSRIPEKPSLANGGGFGPNRIIVRHFTNGPAL